MPVLSKELCSGTVTERYELFVYGFGDLPGNGEIMSFA